MPSTADYCPFCGARLSMDERLDDHFDEAEDCAAAFAQWRPGRSGDTDGSRPTRAQQAVVGVLIVAIMLYATLIQGSILLGIIASALVFVAGRIGWNGGV